MSMVVLILDLQRQGWEAKDLTDEDGVREGILYRGKFGVILTIDVNFFFVRF